MKKKKTKNYLITAVLAILTSIIAGLILMPLNKDESPAERRYSVLTKEADNIMRKVDPNTDLAFFLYNQAYEVAHENNFNSNDAIEGRERTLRHERTFSDYKTSPNSLLEIDNTVKKIDKKAPYKIINSKKENSTKYVKTFKSVGKNNIEIESAEPSCNIIIFNANDFPRNAANYSNYLKNKMSNIKISVPSTWAQRTLYDNTYIVVIKPEHYQNALLLEKILPGRQIIFDYLKTPFWGLENRDIAIFTGKDSKI